MIPKIIHFTIPKNATAQQLANIETARRMHPDWQMKVWQDPVDPTGFRLAKYWSKANSGAQLADMIRLEVVHRDGGFYLDSDFVAQKNLDPLRGYQFVVGSEDGHALTNAFFGAEQGSQALEHLIGVLEADEIDWKIPPDQSTGPQFFAKQLKWRDDLTVVPRETLYPYNWNEKARQAHPWTYGVHCWDNSWKNKVSAKEIYHAVRLKLHTWAQRCRNWLKQKALLVSRLGKNHHPVPFSATGVICAQTIHGFKIYLRGDDGSVTPEIAHQGTYEFDEECFLKSAVRGGDWVIDVGANVGIMTLLCAKRVGPFGRVYAFEPNPTCSSLLKRSLAMNWMHERVKLREMGVGSAPGMLTLRFSPDCLGGATFADQQQAGTLQNTLSTLGNETSTEAPITTLDAEFPVDLPIRLLKMDVEGFEHHVLRGARRLFDQKCIDLLMLECSQEVFGAEWPQFVAELERLVSIGYTPHRLAGGKLHEINLSRALYGHIGRNLFMVAPHAKGTF